MLHKRACTLCQSVCLILSIIQDKASVVASAGSGLQAAQQSARVSSRTVTQDGGSKKQCAKEVQAAQASKSRGRGRGSGPLQGPWLTSSCLTQQSYNLQGASQASICCLVWWALDASVFQALEICNLYDLSVHQLHTQLHT